jgi:tripartite ATP-independent transporter DctM subunit
MTALGIAFVFLLLVGAPLAFTVGISSTLYFVGNPDIPIGVVVSEMIASTNSFPLLAVPFFVLAGNLMNACGITRRLMDYASVLTGHLRGGLAHVNIVLSTLMGGISGSAASDAAMEARILAPAMIQKGYSKGFTAAVTSVSALITATIPPGVGLILYGFVGEVSIGRLFVGGIVPGILMTVLQMMVAWVISLRRAYGKERQKRASLKELAVSTKDNIWALIFPVILIVGIRFGLFTASEAGAFAVVYAFVIGKFVYKELTWKSFVESLRQTAEDNGMIMLIIICSSIFGFVIIVERAPQTLAAALTHVTTNRGIMMLIIVAFLLVAGMVMEPTVNTLLLTPIFLPIVKQLGVDPVHFGMVMMTTITFGSMTPPVGVVLYATCSILECSTAEYVKESMPFFLSVLVLLGMLIYMPQITLFLPNLVFGVG